MCHVYGIHVSFNLSCFMTFYHLTKNINDRDDLITTNALGTIFFKNNLGMKN